MTIRARLIMMFAGMTLSVAVAGGVLWRATSISDFADVFDAKLYHLQTMLRGINEMVITEGTPQSKEVALRGIKGFEEANAHALGLARDAETKRILEEKIAPAWNEIRKKTDALTSLPKGKLSADNDTAMVFYGGVISDAEALTVLVTETGKREKEKAADSLRKAKYAVVGSVLFLFAGFGLVSYSLYRALIKPIDEMNRVLEAFGSGDITARPAHAGKDEFGRLAAHYNRMAVNVGVMIKKVKQGVATVVESSDSMSSVSVELRGSTSIASGKTSAVAKAAQNLTVNMHSVAAASRQTTGSTEAAAVSTEEMKTSILEISRNTQKARQVTREAVGCAGEVSIEVGSLAKAAQEIGAVTKTITDISEQTKLLALNATIEAARAGEAGKGFAVVATEIKELARQTSEATGDISRRVAAIGNSTKKTVDSISRIDSVIHEVDAIVTSIAATVEEQSVTVGTIATGMTETSKAMEEVDKSVIQCSQSSCVISEDMKVVDGSLMEMAAGAERIEASSKKLSELAAELKEEVEKFRT